MVSAINYCMWLNFLIALVFFIFLSIAVLSAEYLDREQIDSCQKGESGGLDGRSEGINQEKKLKQQYGYYQREMAMGGGRRG